jgi:hypothetical protein
VSDPDLGAPELVVGAWRGYRIWRVAGDRLTGCWYTSYAWVPEGWPVRSKEKARARELDPRRQGGLQAVKQGRR